MGKRYNNTASAFSINIAGQVGHVPVKKKEILKVSDEYNANTDQKNQEVLLPRKLMEEIYGIYNYYHKGWADWDKMSRKEKIAYASVVGLTAFGIVAAADYVSNGAVKDTAKKTYDKLFSKSGIKAVGGGIIGAEKAANASATATPQVSETPYSYDARAGNPDPSIPFINGSGDKEWEDVVNWHMEQFKKASPYDIGEFEKYIIFMPGKDPTPKVIDFTKDKRRIVYIDDYDWMSIKSLKEIKNKNMSAWNFYRTTAHFIGHDKFNKPNDDPDSKIIEMPAIEYDTDAMIRVGIFRPEDREKMINSEVGSMEKTA